MQIKKFWAKGYRSLRDVTLDALGPYNVFYGKNGSGKSNVLDAMGVFFNLVPLAMDAAYGPKHDRLSFLDAGRHASEWIKPDDFFARADTFEITFGAEIGDQSGHFGGALFEGVAVTTLRVEVKFSRVREGHFHLKMSQLFVNENKPGLPLHDGTIRAIVQAVVPRAFNHIGVTRTLSTSVPQTPEPFRHDATIRDSDIAYELFRAKNSSDRSSRDRFEQARRFMAKQLGRGAFDVYMNAETNLVELREMLLPPNPLNADIPLGRAGHGVVQSYAIAVSILLGNGRLVAIEEPEAHLHAPTLGRELRRLLRSMVPSEVDQFFIATHSNLFDLDEKEYWDVSLVDGETKVERRGVDSIDLLHLYEPGPAKHQLQLLLKLYGNEVVFNTANGPVSAEEMLVSLQCDDEVAQAFLETVHAAALQVTGLRAKRAAKVASQ